MFSFILDLGGHLDVLGTATLSPWIILQLQTSNCCVLKNDKMLLGEVKPAQTDWVQLCFGIKTFKWRQEDQKLHPDAGETFTLTLGLSWVLGDTEESHFYDFVISVFMAVGGLQMVCVNLSHWGSLVRQRSRGGAHRSRGSGIAPSTGQVCHYKVGAAPPNLVRRDF